jgi:tetratricopeptide (TPR) repeat protein
MTHSIRWHRIARAYEGADRARALAEALRLLSAAEHAGDDQPLGTVVGWLVDNWRLDEANQFLPRLRAADPWRARVEELWLAYRAGADPNSLPDPTALAALVANAPDREPDEHARLALALGKVASDAGALEPARTWILRSARAARDAANDDALAAAYGALGEVLFLGRRVLEALDAFSLDESLLPRGGAERARLLVYRAHCYRELGELEVARALYGHARAVARLHGQPDNSWAVRGLAWCSVRAGADPSTIELPPPGSPIALPEAHPIGMTLLGRAWLHASTGRFDHARGDRDRAAELLEGSQHRLEASIARGHSPSNASLQLPAPPSPEELSACDLSFLAAQLCPLDERVARAARALDQGIDVAGLTGAFF